MPLSLPFRCLLAAGLTLVAATALHAQDDAPAKKTVVIPPRQPGFNFYTAPSGSVEQFALGPTPAERTQHFRKLMLKKYDRNGNGTLDPAEEKQMRQDHYVQKKLFIARWDKNKDEEFGDEELESFKKLIYAKRLRFMQAFDRNNDGTLNSAEVKAMRAEVSKREGKFWREFDNMPTPNKR